MVVEVVVIDSGGGGDKWYCWMCEGRMSGMDG